MANIPIKNLVYDIIKENESLTDVELSKKLTKEGVRSINSRRSIQ